MKMPSSSFSPWSSSSKMLLLLLLLLPHSVIKAEVAPVDPEQEAKLYHGGAKGPNGENSPPSPSAADDGGGGAIVLGDGVVRRPIGVAGAAVRDGGMRGDDQLIRGESARDIIEGRKQSSRSGNDTGDGSSQSGSNLGFTHSFVATLSVIIVSELGDKTFFIAAIMAMRHSRATVFAGAMSALGVMHVMSAFFGYAITVVPRVYTYYISSFLFAVFGLKMLKDGWKMSANEAQEEMEEVQEDLRKREQESGGDLETGLITGKDKKRGEDPPLWAFVSKIFIQAFTMTFLAEWGDRSQLATIVLAAREEITGVVIGGVLGHAMCTGLAVLGGRIIAQRISVRTVTLIGGVVFLLFALTALFMDPNAA